MLNKIYVIYSDTLYFFVKNDSALDCGANFFGYNKKIGGFLYDNRLKLILYDIYI